MILETPASFVERSQLLRSLGTVRSLSLRTNFVWNAAGLMAFALAQWGILVVFAKLGSPAIVGQVVYGLSLTTPIFVVASLQLRMIQATDADNRYSLGQYLGLRASATVLAVVAAAIVAAIIWAAGSGLSAVIVLLWALSKSADSGSDAFYGLFQQSERMDYVGLSLIIRGFLAVASVAVLFRSTHSTAFALTGLAAAWSAGLLLFDIPMARLLVRQPRPPGRASNAGGETLPLVLELRRLWPLCSEAAPLAVVAFLLAVQVQVPRYVVVGLLHTHELGLFSAAAYLTFVGTMLVNALCAPASVRLAKQYAGGARPAFRHLMGKLIVIAAALGITGIVISASAGSRILALLYTKEYSPMAGVLTVLCVGSAISYVCSPFGYAMTALRRYKVQVPIFVVVVLITLISCYWLTEQYGLMGTAVGVLAGNAGQLLMSMAVVVRTEWPDRNLVREHADVVPA